MGDSSQRTRTLRNRSRTYFTAFLKQNKDIFYVCGGIVVKTPDSKDRQVYKVKIDEVSLSSVGQTEERYDQATLLGRVITKKLTELNKEPPDFMKPKGWIRVVRETS